MLNVAGIGVTSGGGVLPDRVLGGHGRTCQDVFGTVAGDLVGVSGFAKFRDFRAAAVDG